ncbi:26S proteasome regulatory subunit 8-like [Centruroides sculpturatus]|uniref:26S proteasome regulatory subunit 8-like n=1 Tax=Centruroides sculpturatus TaxID=218467 RepID=UPI000C6E5B96|nr:26S proteasome regulatory subunit 8-like [Centruroides sculpturatus]
MSGEHSSDKFEDNSDKSNPLKKFLKKEIEKLEFKLKQRLRNLDRLRASRSELNNKVRALREEIEEIENSEPKFVGTLVQKLDVGLALVKFSENMRLVFPASEFIDLEAAKPNDRVAVCTLQEEITDVLPSKQNLRVKSMMLEHVPDVTYDAIGGLDKQIREIRECVELPLKHPELFDRLGVRQPKGVLLYGPPGTGKTLLARAVAHHAKCTFIRAAGTEFVQKYIGEGAELIRDLFRMAKDHAPSIIFLDEVDSIGGVRGKKHDGEVERTAMELLSHLDGFDSSSNIKVIMATNRIEALDPALLRSGRIDRKIAFSRIAKEDLAHVFSIHSAEVKAICTEAGMLAIRNKRNYVTREDFETAIEKVATKKKCLDVDVISLEKMWK